MDDCLNSLPHSWREIREGVRWCPVCNLVESVPTGNVYPHPGLFVTGTNPKPAGELGQVIQFEKRVVA